ncbi:hypothetical protein AAEO56_05360 [Flavobacterium sp. DGU11]|uniref:Immunity protein 63 n=1 Tax=Flavobacterium arundinis TaxID=3139143 RepID=A0ABU9HU43_9FLAO
MESNIMDILGLLIVDDYILTSLIFQGNTLQTNIELLKKVSKHRQFEKNIIDDLIGKIGNIKSKRNLFIHGVWGEPYEFENDILIKCYESRLHIETEVKNGFTTTWTSKQKEHEFRLTYIRKLVIDIDHIILAQDSLINRLDQYLIENNTWE